MGIFRCPLIRFSQRRSGGGGDGRRSSRQQLPEVSTTVRTQPSSPSPPLNLSHQRPQTSPTVAQSVASNQQHHVCRTFGRIAPKLPTSGEGTELTVRELEEMACRQQHQIESQRQLLAAKEQRLRYLKQHDTKHHQVAAEHERLRRLRDRVEAQEQKLRKLRALRGQVDQTKLNNVTLTSDLESIRALFNEKEKELTVAVAKVDELTRQLEDVQKGRGGQSQQTSPASMELDKLRAELLYRNKLGEQQTARLVQQREVLSKRQEEMASIDRRISELQARLHRKRLLNQQLANQIQANKPAHNNRSLGGKQMMPLCDGKISGGNVAAVEPFNHVPGPLNKNSQLRKSEDNILSHATGYPGVARPEQKPLSQQPLPVLKQGPEPYQQYQSKPAHEVYKIEQQTINGNQSDPMYFGKFDPKYQTLPYNTKFSPLANYNGNNQPMQPQQHYQQQQQQYHYQQQQQWYGQHNDEMSDENRDLVNNNGYGDQKVNGTAHNKKSPVISGQVMTNLGQNLQMQSSSRPINAQVYHTKPLSSTNLVAAPRPPNYSMHPQVLNSRSQPVGGSNLNNHQVQPVQPQVMNSMGANQTTVRELKSIESNNDRPPSPSTIGKPALPPKPPPPSVGIKTSTPPPPPRQSAYQLHQQQPQYHQPVTDNNQPILTTVDEGRSYFTADSSSGKPLNLISKDLTSPPSRIPNGVIKSGFGNSVDSSESDNSSSSASVKSSNFSNIKNGNHLLDSVRQMNISSKSSPPPSAASTIITDVNSNKEQLPALTDKLRLPLLNGRTSAYPISSTDIINGNVDIKNKPSPTSSTLENNNQKNIDETDRVAVSVAQRIDELETRFGGGNGGGLNNCGGGSSSTDDNSTSNHSSSSPDSGQDSGRDDVISLECRNRLVMRKKGNLKESGGSVGHKRRVSFDPLALLLDASLEGELELVMRTAEQVGNPSAANDEGITALHNAICAGHIDIVKFLVKFGCDVNAQDSDGWTPLHCAASCNNLSMVRFLVEHGACIFATTLSDQETAAEKCEEDEEGFDGCSEFLYSVQEKLGIMNNGVVYAVFGYEAHNQDELSFGDGDRIVVLRKGDDNEREWWWSRIDDREGYVPRNLLGLYPRVISGKKSTVSTVAE
ncbi:apoptosis-stimulating of p53 protein 1 isoform X3 [Daktulosphaira vitifoliae]|uniref:apoptosis-stimulating of p53 protein 1 isoform X3 n=1 Tax=Daktulosphaira vitifoliae TaxID=58002 RepID=UPI0021A9D0B9|nr:apoptosis-stimulating of p53 protein 1 isoform X3 [Daktulosphaira vitifoliae]